MVKEFLSERNIGYEERDVSVDPAAASEMVRISGQKGVPVTLIGNNVIVGFNRQALEQALQSRGKPLFGISIADAGRVKALFGTGITAGAYVGRVKENSPAAGLGLQAGDIILEINGRRIEDASTAEKILSNLNPGDGIVMLILRNGQQLRLEGNY